MSDSGRPFFDQFLDDYFAECEEHLTSARGHILSLENIDNASVIDSHVLDELARSFHSLKGLSAMVGVDEATTLSHRIEDYLRELKRPGVIPTHEGLDRMLAGVDAIERVVAARRQSAPPPDISTVLLQLDAATEEAREHPAAARSVGQWRFQFRPSADLAKQGVTVGSVRDMLRGVGQVIRATPQVAADGGISFEFIVATDAPQSSFEKFLSQGIEYSLLSPEAKSEQPAPREATPAANEFSSGPSNVIRVEMSRLDDLMRMVGELVISRFRLNEVLRSRASKEETSEWRALQEINTSMERQLRELREGVMRARVVPMGQIFERMRFAVRSLERDAGKQMEVHIEGQDTEIDKVIVEKMMDPLLHLIRNCVSHGIESPDERIAAGKSAAGHIWLRASTSGDTVSIEVSDDGSGMDIERIASRARELQLMRPGDAMDSKRLLDIICSPGFTTRSTADLASGRGVGMEAVRAAVVELGGTIEVETKPGEGTRFAMRLPLTLLIADSLVVTVAQQRFAVPQTAVREVLAIEPSNIKVLENNEIVPYRDGVLPIVRLSRFFGLQGASQTRMHLLVVADGGSPVGLAVDRITGQREIVVQAISDPLSRAPGIVGATELGDGRPVLILDPYSIIRAAS